MASTSSQDDSSSASSSSDAESDVAEIEQDNSDFDDFAASVSHKHRPEIQQLLRELRQFKPSVAPEHTQLLTESRECSRKLWKATEAVVEQEEEHQKLSLIHISEPTRPY
eukprot:TRINITY_DN20329_c0_g1_i1.p1 TRINITY_DN20329_c0_g1~~TRINITY_DN20329_c0_g1_i1.p1  ORF type:complete len:110 (+),score=24.75 TRINITY_DN20329_c0_g1_i1:195-524(+)